MTPLSKGVRSASPFCAIKPCGYSALTHINAMVNAPPSAEKHTKRPRSGCSSAGRSGRPSTPQTMRTANDAAPQPMMTEYHPEASIEQLFASQLDASTVDLVQSDTMSYNVVPTSAARTLSSLMGASAGGMSHSAGDLGYSTGNGTTTAPGEATEAKLPAKRSRSGSRGHGNGRGRGRPPKDAYLPCGRLMSMTEYTARQPGLPLPTA